MEKIVIGLSGGVDSAVAARLLQREGCEVIGATVLTGFGPSVEPEAREVAARLGIEFRPVDVSARFRREVAERFAQEYLKGRTPNPCVLCNPAVKWEALFEVADSVGADRVATGHYGEIARLANGRFAVAKAPVKDQSYVLWGLSQAQLARTRTVLSGLTKEEVRRIAREEGLGVESKPDSQEICFVPDGDYARFVEDFTGVRSVPGSFVDPQGRVLGTHRGLIHYTVGQRKGLGLAFGEPRFVTELRPAVNEVVLGLNEDCFARGLIAEGLNWQALGEAELRESGEAAAADATAAGLASDASAAASAADLASAAAPGLRLLGKIRYAHREEPCTLRLLPDGRALCLFDEPQRAITPGQSVVWYRDGLVAGGGVIAEVVK